MSEEKKNKKAFHSWDTARFHLNFPNGNNISTVFGDGTYSENYASRKGIDYILDKTKEKPVYDSNTVEIMFDCSEKLKKKILKKYKENRNCKSFIKRITMTPHETHKKGMEEFRRGFVRNENAENKLLRSGLRQQDIESHITTQHKALLDSVIEMVRSVEANPNRDFEESYEQAKIDIESRLLEEKDKLN